MILLIYAIIQNDNKVFHVLHSINLESKYGVLKIKKLKSMIYL